jgi:hypothetical protein
VVFLFWDKIAMQFFFLLVRFICYAITGSENRNVCSCCFCVDIKCNDDGGVH